jgi:hypothetical protein
VEIVALGIVRVNAGAIEVLDERWIEESWTFEGNSGRFTKYSGASASCAKGSSFVSAFSGSPDCDSLDEIVK